MPERDLDQAYSIILEALRAHGLSWVAAQVQDQVRAGKPTTRMVAPRPAAVTGLFADELSQPRSPRRERLAATEPYSPKERLGLALDALERAVIQTGDMEEEVMKFFATERQTPPQVIFQPEEFEDARPLVIGSPDQARRAALGRLRQALVTLRMELASHGDH